MTSMAQTSSPLCAQPCASSRAGPTQPGPPKCRGKSRDPLPLSSALTPHPPRQANPLSCFCRCRFLKQPPPESEHLTFLRRLLSSPPHPSTPADEAGLSIHIPPPPQRIPWLWPLGRPTGKGRMRVTVDEGEVDPTASLAASTTSTLSRKPDLSASAMERALTASAAHHPNAHVRHLTEGLQLNGTDSLPTSRARSVTPSHGRWASMVPSVAGTPVASAPGSAHGGSRPTSEAGEEAGDEDEDEGSQGGQVGDGEEGGGGEFEGDDDEDGEEEEEEDEEEEEEVEPLSRTVEALDLF